MKDHLSNVWAYVLGRLQERSTWLTIAVLAGTLLGREISPEQAETITTVGLLIAGAVAAGTKEHKPE